jgi:hypothetical protein
VGSFGALGGNKDLLWYFVEKKQPKKFFGLGNGGLVFKKGTNF